MQHNLFKMPNILVVHLKRFNYFEGNQQKIYSPVYYKK